MELDVKMEKSVRTADWMSIYTAALQTVCVGIFIRSHTADTGGATVTGPQLWKDFGNYRDLLIMPKMRLRRPNRLRPSNPSSPLHWLLVPATFPVGRCPKKS